MAEGNYKASAEVLELLVDQDPGHAAGQFALAIDYQYSGRYTDATERFQLAKALCPRDHRPAFTRGLALTLMNKQTEAIKEFSSALQRDPKFAKAYYHRALAETRLGQFGEAIADATRALDLGEQAYRTLMLRG